MFAFRLMNPFVLLVALAGCNSAHVMQKNIERTAQNWGKPKERPWPMHPATAGSPRKDDPRFASPVVQEEEQRDDEAEDDEIIQTGGQMTSGTGVISGRVVDSSGRPQPNVSVLATATRRSGSARAEVTTDAGGNFVLRGLAPAQRYLILASAIRNSSSLIGRVSSVPPDQGVVIEIAVPFTANRESMPRSVALREPTRPMAPAAETATGRGNSRPMHNQNPFAERSEFAETKASALNNGPATAPSQPVKRTREQALAENRLDSPWDMPAPSTRRTPASTATKPSQAISSNTSDSIWKPVGSRPVQLSAKPREKVLETPRPEIAPTEPEADSSPARGAFDSNLDPRRPLSQPITIDANAKPDRPRALMTKANVPLEGRVSDVRSPGSGVSNPLPDAGSLTTDSSLPRHALHDGPMCEFDGKRLVDFQLTDVHGQPVSFAGINGRFVLIDFWTTWCGPCLRAMPHLINLQRRFGPQGLQVVGIACEQGQDADRVARVSQIREQLGINYPLLLDDGNEKFLVRDKFGVGVYPTLILLDKSGTVLWRSEGPDQADLQQLEKLLKTQLATTSSRYN